MHWIAISEKKILALEHIASVELKREYYEHNSERYYWLFTLIDGKVVKSHYFIGKDGYKEAYKWITSLSAVKSSTFFPFDFLKDMKRKKVVF